MSSKLQQMPEEIYRITIQISESEMKVLKLWSKWHGKPKATYASQIISARLEANVDTVDNLVAREARRRGIPSEELESLWLQDGDE